VLVYCNELSRSVDARVRRLRVGCPVLIEPTEPCSRERARERERGKEGADRHVVVELRAPAELLAVGNRDAVAIRVAGCATFAVVKLGATTQGDTLRSASLRMRPS
jgi:hypothetical protein